MRRLILSAAALAAAGLAAGAAQAQDISWVVQAEDAPQKQPWTEPASFSFKSVSDGDDVIDAAIAVRASTPLPVTDGSLFVSAAAIRRTNPGKEQEYYALKVGGSFTLTNVSIEPVDPDAPGGPRDAFALYVDPSVSLARTTAFRDLKAVCTPPAPATCRDQYESSVRVEVKAQLFNPNWTNAPYSLDGGESWQGRGLLWEFAPVATLFYDEVVDAKADATGAKMEGSVTGLQLSLNGALTPRMSDDPDRAYRLVFKGSVKAFTALDRSGPRAAAFPEEALLVTLSASYEFGNRSFEFEKGWAPSIGITYTNGEDPTTGRPDSEDVVLAFKIALVN